MTETHRFRGAAALLLTLLFVFQTVLPAFAAGNGIAGILNEAELHPVEPQSAALAELVDEIMDEIIDYDEMDTYAQVVACYDYLVETVSYGSHISRLSTPINDSVTCRAVYNAYGAVEGYGAVALTAKVGLCNAYNAAFILMVRRIGFEADLVTGYTRSGGSWVYHEWTEVTIDGQVYVFDPQLDQSLRRAGLPAYSVFGVTYAETNRYSKS